MKTLRTIVETQTALELTSRPLVLVPTMGALHAGHAALFDAARNLAGPEGTVAASIFVNPTQFGPKEDLSQYPRPFDHDQTLCEKHGVDILFAPSGEEMYPADFSTWANEDSVSVGLCGGTRPGHFRGVCTVVLKLLMICRPTHAVFGKKDFQQCAVISRMVRDLNIPVRLHFEDTIREPDGLALSSRNVYLSREERLQATALNAALEEARNLVGNGERNTLTIESTITQRILRCSLARVDYVAVVDGSSLQPVTKIKHGDVAAVAVFFRKTRLIDNVQLL